MNYFPHSRHKLHDLSRSSWGRKLPTKKHFLKGRFEPEVAFHVAKKGYESCSPDVVQPFPFAP